jgi:putative NIF3 family GTP cyclohydrolase 1 type 2
MDTDQIMRSALKLASMRNVPADSEIHVKGGRIKRVLVSIDVGTSELLLSRELGCDAVIAHHPAGGTAQLEGYKVFHRHVDQLIQAGVPKQAAEKAVATKFHQLEVQHHSRNYDQTTSAARRLRIPLMSIHSPCDEIGRKIMIQAVKRLDSNAKVSDMVSQLNRLPEYRNAETKIEVRLGSPKNGLGKLAISHAAYTNGGYDVAKAYFEHGVDTLSYIHVSDVDLTRLVDEKKGNLVVTGHIASDWLGLNRLIVDLERNGVEVISTTDLQARS